MAALATKRKFHTDRKPMRNHYTSYICSEKMYVLF